MLAWPPRCSARALRSHGRLCRPAPVRCHPSRPSLPRKLLLLPPPPQPSKHEDDDDNGGEVDNAEVDNADTASLGDVELSIAPDLSDPVGFMAQSQVGDMSNPQAGPDPPPSPPAMAESPAAAAADDANAGDTAVASVAVEVASAGELGNAGDDKPHGDVLREAEQL